MTRRKCRCGGMNKIMVLEATRAKADFCRPGIVLPFGAACWLRRRKEHMGQGYLQNLQAQRFVILQEGVIPCAVAGRAAALPRLDKMCRRGRQVSVSLR